MEAPEAEESQPVAAEPSEVIPVMESSSLEEGETRDDLATS